jgi:hypothetical protein
MCNKPICKDCGISTAAGIFCSEECAQKMHAHVERVKEIDKERPIIKPKRVPTIIKLLIILAILWLIAHLLGVNVIERLRELITSFS